MYIQRFISFNAIHIYAVQCSEAVTLWLLLLSFLFSGL